MKITQKKLAQAKEGMDIIKRTGRDIYIKMSENSRYIEYIIEKGNTYYCVQGEDAYVFWNEGAYGFTFSPDIFEEVKNA